MNVAESIVQLADAFYEMTGVRLESIRIPREQYLRLRHALSGSQGIRIGATDTFMIMGIGGVTIMPEER